MFSFTFLSHYYHSLSPFTLIFAYINTRASPKHPLSLSLSLSREDHQGFHQRALCTWVQDSLQKDIIRKLNTVVVHTALWRGSRTRENVARRAAPQGVCEARRAAVFSGCRARTAVHSQNLDYGLVL